MIVRRRDVKDDAKYLLQATPRLGASPLPHKVDVLRPSPLGRIEINGNRMTKISHFLLDGSPLLLTNKLVALPQNHNFDQDSKPSPPL
jgi:hypothetical protein